METKKRNFLALCTVLAIGSVCLISAAIINSNIEVYSATSEYTLLFNKNKNKIPSGSGKSEIQSDLGNPFTVSYTSLASYSNGWALIKNGGYILTTSDESINDNKIRELTNITFSFPDASMFATFNIYTSITGNFSSPAFKKYTVKHNSITFDLGGHTRYFKIESLSSNLYINEIKIIYNCGSDSSDTSWYKSHGAIPLFNDSKTTIRYGIYPTSKVINSTTKTNLTKQISERLDYTIGDLLWYNNNYYISTLNTSGSYIFYQCGYLVWNIVDKKDDIYLLNCQSILDFNIFGNNNEYSTSEIHDYLVNTMFDKMFFLYNEIILPNDDHNGDKIYLSSVDEYNSWYVDSTKKQKKVSDYVTSKGATSTTKKYGEYWTITKNEDDACYFMNTSGEATSYKDTKEKCGIVPTIKVQISQYS